jgi:hypothetical protein
MAKIPTITDAIQFPLSRSELSDLTLALEMHIDFQASQLDDMRALLQRIKAALEPNDPKTEALQ